ncbi:hypothetical protein HDU76_012311, partial [Blyttiomyces sp. JEL0837]
MQNNSNVNNNINYLFNNNNNGNNNSNISQSQANLLSVAATVGQSSSNALATPTFGLPTMMQPQTPFRSNTINSSSGGGWQQQSNVQLNNTAGVAQPPLIPPPVLDEAEQMIEQLRQASLQQQLQIEIAIETQREAARTQQLLQERAAAIRALTAHSSLLEQQRQQSVHDMNVALNMNMMHQQQQHQQQQQMMFGSMPQVPSTSSSSSSSSMSSISPSLPSSVVPAKRPNNNNNPTSSSSNLGVLNNQNKRPRPAPQIQINDNTATAIAHALANAAGTNLQQLQPGIPERTFNAVFQLQNSQQSQQRQPPNTPQQQQHQHQQQQHLLQQQRMSEAMVQSYITQAQAGTPRVQNPSIQQIRTGQPVQPIVTNMNHLRGGVQPVSASSAGSPTDLDSATIYEKNRTILKGLAEKTVSADGFMDTCKQLLVWMDDPRAYGHGVVEVEFHLLLKTIVERMALPGYSFELGIKVFEVGHRYKLFMSPSAR